MHRQDLQSRNGLFGNGHGQSLLNDSAHTGPAAPGETPLLRRGRMSRVRIGAVLRHIQRGTTAHTAVGFWGLAVARMARRQQSRIHLARTAPQLQQYARTIAPLLSHLATNARDAVATRNFAARVVPSRTLSRRRCRRRVTVTADNDTVRVTRDERLCTRLCKWGLIIMTTVGAPVLTR